MKLTELECGNCAAPLAAEQMDLRLGVARCIHCGAVFALEKIAGQRRSDQNETKIRPRVNLPAGMELVDLGSTMEIRRRWFSVKLFFLLFFCVFWNGFMVFWHVMAIASGAWFMSLFGLLHTAVGIGVAYGTAAGFLNTTVIRAGQGMLEVTHGPLPWGGNKSLPSHDIQQLFCCEHRHHSKNGVHYTFEVLAVSRNQAKDKLLDGLDDADQALFIEQELERFLGLKDREVEGELSR